MEWALGELDANSEGMLILGRRHRLWSAYGPWRPVDEGPLLAGSARRYALQRAGVVRALPIWEAARPDDRRPQEMIAMADAIQDGRLGVSEPNEMAADFNQALGDLYGDGAIRYAPSAAGIAAGMLPYVAAATDFEQLEGRDGEDVLDGEWGPDELPADFFAAEAFATEHAPGEDDARVDVDARRGFWRWYVCTAFPAAYRVA